MLTEIFQTGLTPIAISYIDPSCGIKATDDIEAVQSWLNEYQDNKNTYSSYKGEVVKFLIWCKVENKKEFAALKKEDINAYITWLKNPPSKWIKSKASKNEEKPFKGSQTYSSLQYNIRVINSLLNFLVEADYIYKNPIRLIKQFSKFKDPNDRKLQVGARILEDNEFKAVLDTLTELPEVTKIEREIKVRAKLIFALLYHLGLRISELSNATWDSFKIVQGKCWFFLVGKGSKPGKIPVNTELLEILKKYREYFGLHTNIAQFENEYILKSKKTRDNLSARRIREIVKEIFINTAEKFTDENVKTKLKNASPHDLRHLLASDLDKIGVSIVDTKEILRHSSEKTTEIYRNSKESKRHESIQANTVGICEILNNKIENYTEINITVVCREQDSLSFNYFINAVRNIYLKNYTLIGEKDLSVLKQEFKQKSQLCADFSIKYLVKEKFDAVQEKLLKELIEEAANCRNIKLTVIISVSK